MTFQIIDKVTPRRRCGLRKPGGLYLCADGPAAFCGKLPVPLERCPCCDAGIKPARGWTWIDADPFFKDRPCLAPKCVACPLSKPLGRCGLLWIGGCYYPTPQSWTDEADAQGVSRRIKDVPRGFVIGATWVLVAHRHAITAFMAPLEAAKVTPGIFRAFRPSRVEYVVGPGDTPEKLESLAKRGITLVRDHLPEPAPLPLPV